MMVSSSGGLVGRWKVWEVEDVRWRSLWVVVFLVVLMVSRVM